MGAKNADLLLLGFGTWRLNRPPFKTGAKVNDPVAITGPYVVSIGPRSRRGRKAPRHGRGRHRRAGVSIGPRSRRGRKDSIPRSWATTITSLNRPPFKTGAKEGEKPWFGGARLVSIGPHSRRGRKRATKTSTDGDAHGLNRPPFKTGAKGDVGVREGRDGRSQ